MIKKLTLATAVIALAMLTASGFAATDRQEQMAQLDDMRKECVAAQTDLRRECRTSEEDCVAWRDVIESKLDRYLTMLTSFYSTVDDSDTATIAYCKAELAWTREALARIRDAKRAATK
jgi:hypothetical protein